MDYTRRQIRVRFADTAVCRAYQDHKNPITEGGKADRGDNSRQSGEIVGVDETRRSVDVDEQGDRIPSRTSDRPKYYFDLTCIFCGWPEKAYAMWRGEKVASMNVKPITVQELIDHVAENCARVL